MTKEKCYHMTEALKQIIEDQQLQPRVGKNSEHVNDVKEENIGISYSLGLEGIIATNAMFRARYQYDLLENQTDRDVTLDDMFSQDVYKQENEALGGRTYLVFDETETVRDDNKERDIADPKVKSAIDLENISGVILKNNKTGQIKYDRTSIIEYAVSQTSIDDVLDKLVSADVPFMNMEGYAKTDFSFKDYVKRYYEEFSKNPEISEFRDGKYELEEINVNEFLKLLEKDKIDKKGIINIAKKDEVVEEQENALQMMTQLENQVDLEKNVQDMKR